jgi:predicted dehydrogenase
MAYRQTTVTACADLYPEKAAEQAAAYGVPWSGTPDELLKRDDVDVVVNLTNPAAHHSVAKAALESGKLAYNEKPFCIERAEGAELVSLAKAKGLAVGCAPDTFLGAGLQTCRKLIDEGAIGQPIGFNGFMLSHGTDGWHPNAGFFYQRGGGPLFDMGPYYLTALVFLLGPIARVMGLASTPFPTRVLRSGAKAGTELPIETPMHIVGALEFASGVNGQLNVSFESWGGDVPNIEIYGSEGTMTVPDPNTFGNPIKIRKPGETCTRDIFPFRFRNNNRGLGVLDLAVAHRDNRPARASGELAFHVLDVSHAILESSERKASVSATTQPVRPAPMAAEGPEDDL